MLTMEVTLSTAFGRAVDVQGGKGGKLYEAAANAFSDFSPDESEEANDSRKDDSVSDA